MGNWEHFLTKKNGMDDPVFFLAGTLVLWYIGWIAAVPVVILLVSIDNDTDQVMKLSWFIYSD